MNRNSEDRIENIALNLLEIIEISVKNVSDASRSGDLMEASMENVNYLLMARHSAETLKVLADINIAQ